MNPGQKYEKAREQLQEIANNPDLMQALFSIIENIRKKDSIKQSKETYAAIQDKHFPNSIIRLFDENNEDHFYVLAAGRELVLGKGEFGRIKFAAAITEKPERYKLDLDLCVIKIQRNEEHERLIRTCNEYLFTKKVLGSRGYSFRELSMIFERSKSYFEMPYINGVTLDAFLKDVEGGHYRLSLDDRFALAKKILLVYQDLHQQKECIHKDMKLDNIMLEGDFHHPDSLTVKLIDFGMSKSIHNKSVLPIGSYDCMPPELLVLNAKKTNYLFGKIDDHKSDIYALGYVLARVFGSTEKMLESYKALASKTYRFSKCKPYYILQEKRAYSDVLSTVAEMKTQPHVVNQLCKPLKAWLQSFDNAHQDRPEIDVLLEELQKIELDYQFDVSNDMLQRVELNPSNDEKMVESISLDESSAQPVSPSNALVNQTSTTGNSLMKSMTASQILIAQGFFSETTTSNESRSRSQQEHKSTTKTHSKCIIC